MKLSRIVLTGSLVFAAACGETTAPPADTVSSGSNPSFLLGDVGQKVHIMPLNSNVWEAQAKAGPGGGGSGTGIFYHGGPILVSPKAAAIYWGTSTIYNGGPAPGTNGSGGGDGSLVGYFLSNLGGSNYWGINNTYYDGSNNHVAKSLGYTQFYAANSAPPASPTDADMQTLLTSAINGGKLALDASTVYAIFTGPGVNLGGGFGSQYCAYHGKFTINGTVVAYAAMPYDYDFVSGCTANLGSPNNDPAADAEVNTLAHELEEAATDVQLNAWYDRRGYENADKCAWTWGTTYKTSNGATANMNFGSRDWLIQRNWKNSGSGGCFLS